MLFVERAFGFGIFDPARGGDPVLFQHLFWFYSHPAVYIMILPAMGVMSELVAAFSRKKIFGYSFVAFSSLAIAIFGFIVWAHHMFVVGHSAYCRDGVLVPQLLGRDSVGGEGVQLDRDALQGRELVRDADALRLRLPRPVHHRRARPGSFLATLGTDVHLHDTYFVVAHFHYIMVGGAIMGYLGGLHYLVAEDGRPDVLRILVARQRDSGVRRLQPDVLPAVHRRLYRHAAPVSRLPGRVPGAERDVVGGRSMLGVGYVLPVLYFLLSLKTAKWRGRIRGAPRASNGRYPRRRRPRISR